MGMLPPATHGVSSADTQQTTPANAGQAHQEITPEQALQLTPHPYALMCPPLEDAAFNALTESIGTHGQLFPIIVNARNQIGDGVHRCAACIKLGIALKIEVRDITDDEVLSLVIAANVNRRHLNEAQRAAIAALIRKTANLPPSQKALARLFNVSVRSIRSAERVLEASPDLHQEMMAGKASVHLAENVVNLPDEERAGAIQQIQTADTSKVNGRRGKPTGLRSSRPSQGSSRRGSKAGTHGDYGVVYNALYELPKLLVDHPLDAEGADDLVAELRNAIELIESASQGGGA